MAWCTSTRTLGDADVATVRDTWKRLGHLIPYHSRTFYIPGSLFPEVRFAAYSVLQSKEFGVRHWDMQMTRFVVPWARPGDLQSDATLALTGWEHAARAPLVVRAHAVLAASAPAPVRAYHVGGTAQRPPVHLPLHLPRRLCPAGARVGVGHRTRVWRDGAVVRGPRRRAFGIL